MVKLSKSVRELFKKQGLDDISIFASGGFDEFKISHSVKDGAEIDAFGVGTKMGTSADSPYTDMAFKLVEYDERPVLKLSTGKKTLVGRKQVFRQTDGGRFFSKDLIALRDEKIAGEPLLEAVMHHGERLRPAPSLDAMHQCFQRDFNALDDSIKALESPVAYPVDLVPRGRDGAAGRSCDGFI